MLLVTQLFPVVCNAKDAASTRPFPTFCFRVVGTQLFPVVCNAKDAASTRPFPTFHLLSLGCWAVVRFAIGAIN